MDNPEISATLSTQDTGRRQTIQKKKQDGKPKRWATHTPPKTRECSQIFVKSKQSLPHIRYPQC
jgi:hypothetical protein